MKPLQPGNSMPQFTLPDQDGILIHSDSFLGKKTLLYFYPKSMTPGCTVQACKLRDNINAFQKLDTEIIGITTESSEKLLKFSETENLNFTLLSDTNHYVSNKFGVWGEKTFMGKKYYGTHRISFLINSIGLIEKTFKNFQPHEHHKIILNYLNTT